MRSKGAAARFEVGFRDGLRGEGPAMPTADAAAGLVAVATWPFLFGIVVAPAMPLLPWGRGVGMAMCAVQLACLAADEVLDRRGAGRDGPRQFLLTGVLVAAFFADVHQGLAAFTVGALLVQFRRATKRGYTTALVQAIVYATTPLFLVGMTLTGTGWRADGPEFTLFSGREATFGNVAADVLRAFVVLLLIVAQTVQTRRATREEERAQRLEAEREDALRVERARIARDLHDVVAHHVSVMTIQTEAARESLPPGAAAAERALETVSSTGRTALVELRRLLAILRTAGDDDDAVALAPQPGLARVPELVETARRSGLRVDYDVVGSPRDIPAAVDVCGYRIVQEALTNVLRHAGAGRAWVTVRYGDDRVDVEVVDDGGGGGDGGAAASGKQAASEQGQGQAGIRERAALVGGETEIGPLPDGGYRVAARLPLSSAT